MTWKLPLYPFDQTWSGLPHPKHSSLYSGAGRFDPAALEEKLENSERMERLWTAWQTDPEARTLVFCCSQRHARFVRLT